ncbi:MAG: hypothetical protein ABSB83_03275 [Methanomassiliicoccales archaeon]|jgi:hypothetical protein
MRIFVEFEVFDSVPRDDDVKRVRRIVGKQFQEIQKSAKFIEGGMFADVRAGYFVLEVDKSTEIMDLLGDALIDNCHIKTHPLITLKDLGEFF